MQLISSRLETFINQHLAALQAIPEQQMIYKPSPAKWSKKEIIGHLIDSAQNNIRRFVVSQYEETPHIVYNQDKWVAIAAYQQYEVNDLINLWFALHKHLVNILKNMSPEMGNRTCRTQTLHTLEWLAEDYLKHLRHHIHQVLELEPVEYP